MAAETLPGSPGEASPEATIVAPVAAVAPLARDATDCIC